MSATSEKPQRRRDGTEIAAAQQQGQGPAAVPIIATGIATAGEALDATRQAVAAAPTLAAKNAAAAGILAAFDRFFSQRRVEQGAYVQQVLEHQAPDLSAGARQDLSADEMAREQAFAAKARGRINGDISAILEIDDPDERKRALEALVQRERRYIEQREAAMDNRTSGAVQQRKVEEASPAGGFWRLDDSVQSHTPDCLAMANKVWPHSVLRNYHPPLHGMCPCEIITPQQAVSEGLLSSSAQWATADQAVPAMQVTESIRAGEVDELGEFLDSLVLEAVYDARWGKGTTKAGQFRPRRGGDPGRVLIHDHPLRMPNLRSEGAVQRVASIRHEAHETSDLNVAGLAENDHVMINGQLERVTKVHGGTPGLVTLEHTGMVHIDRQTIQGVKGGQARADEVKGGGAKSGFSVDQLVENFRTMHGHDPSPEQIEQLKKAHGVKDPVTSPDEPEAKPEPAADFDPRGLDTGLTQDTDDSRRVMQIGLRQVISTSKPTTLPGGIRIVPGAQSNTINGGKSRPMAFRVHNGEGGHVDVAGSDRAAVAALHASANSAHPDSLGGTHRHDDYHEVGINDSQKITLAASVDGVNRHVVGYTTAGNPVTAEKRLYRGQKEPKVLVGTEREVMPDGTAPRLAGRGYTPANVPASKVKTAEPKPEGAPKGDGTRDLPPAGLPTGGPSFEDVERELLTRKLGKAPKEAGEILPGFHAKAPGEKVSYKHELQGSDLHLGNGFFRQGRDRREAIVFRHYGKQLSDSLGQPGRDQLGVDKLSTEKGIQDAYFGINSDATRDEFAAMHPDAASKVATAALERGLPLHPEAAKLARRPAVADVAEPEHPAHDLARQLVGTDEANWQRMIGGAGYHFGGSQKDPQGNLQIVHHNFDTGSSLITTHHGGGPEDGKITAASAIVHDAVPSSESAAVKGMSDSATLEHMEGQGFSYEGQTGGKYLTFVHPDGRARAVEIDTSKEDAHGRPTASGKVSAFTPTDSEVQRARSKQIQRDPLTALKPGDDINAAYSALNEPNSGWKTGTQAPDGSFIAHTTTHDDPDGKHVSVQGDASGLVSGVGVGSIRNPGTILNSAEAEAEKVAIKAENDRKEADAKAAAEVGGQAVRDAIAKGSKADLEKALADRLGGENYGLNAATVLLRDEFGFTVRKRGRRQGQMTYTLRGPNSETVTLAGSNGFGGGATKVMTLTKSPQGKRTRLESGQVPKDAKTMYEAALGRADQLGERFGASVNVNGIVKGGTGRRAAAHHEGASGTIAMSTDSHNGLNAYLKKHAAGEALTQNEHMSFYNHLETLQHEINHGLGAAEETPGSGEGGMAFTSRKHYQGVGLEVEEALTEENAHTLTADWLRQMGLTDVLQTLKEQPDDYRTLGSYQSYRTPLKAILDDANIPPEERQQLLERMKFTMTPEQQYQTITELAGAEGIHQAWRGPGTRESVDRRREMNKNFEPVMRPDLNDVPDAPAPTVTAQDGNPVGVGSTVTIQFFSRNIAGEVVSVRKSLGFAGGVVVSVRTPDGEIQKVGESHILSSGN